MPRRNDIPAHTHTHQSSPHFDCLDRPTKSGARERIQRTDECRRLYFLPSTADHVHGGGVRATLFAHHCKSASCDQGKLKGKLTLRNISGAAGALRPRPRGSRCRCAPGGILLVRSCGCLIDLMLRWSVGRSVPLSTFLRFDAAAAASGGSGPRTNRPSLLPSFLRQSEEIDNQDLCAAAAALPLHCHS